MGIKFLEWTRMMFVEMILGTEIAYIPQSAMNALNPTQKVIHLVEDVIQAHHPEIS